MFIFERKFLSDYAESSSRDKLFLKRIEIAFEDRLKNHPLLMQNKIPLDISLKLQSNPWSFFMIGLTLFYDSSVALCNHIRFLHFFIGFLVFFETLKLVFVRTFILIQLVGSIIVLAFPYGVVQYE